MMRVVLTSMWYSNYKVSDTNYLAWIILKYNLASLQEGKKKKEDKERI